MRRGRIATGAIAVIAAALFVVPTAFADATPQDIYKDLADNGRLDGTYSQAELERFLRDASVQGYGSPIVVTLPPIVTSTPPTTQSTPTPTPAPEVCKEVAAGTPGATQAPNGKWYTGPNAHLCGPAAVTVPGPETTPVSEVAGEQVIVLNPVTGVAGATKTKPGVAGERHSKPLGATVRSGSLPFTGAELTLFAIVGTLLIASGLLLRTTARQKSRS